MIINLFINHAKQLRDFVLDLIFPIECLGCAKEGGWLCERCFSKLKFKSSQYCLHCKTENKLGQFCLNCKSHYNLDGIWIASLYEEQIIAKLVKSLKYRFTRGIAEDLGRFLTLFLQDLVNLSDGKAGKSRLSRADLISGVGVRRFEQTKELPKILLQFGNSLIMPVPLANKRKRWRGFNQAEIIAREIAKYFKLKLIPNKLIRIKHKKPQAKLGEDDRKRNIVGCFALEGDKLAGENVILIDDVVTTGSTLNECAKVLKDNGAGEVWGLVVAKG